MRTIVLTALLFIVFSCSEKHEQRTESIFLHDGWTLHESGDTVNYPASVPGCVHLDLMEAGVIPDPFCGENEGEVQWVEERYWEYEKEFMVPRVILEKDVVQLVFEGLDTYADVFLNGSRVLVTDNMFRAWKINVKTLLQPGTNVLLIRFHPPSEIIKERAAKHPYPLPDERAFIRKAPYQFGWDWGPRLVTSGIWKPLKLLGWSKINLMSGHIETEFIDSVENVAGMRATFEIESMVEGMVDLVLEMNTGEKLEKKLQVREGENIISFSFRIEDPELWWIRSLGNPFLYEYIAEWSLDGEPVNRSEGRFGIRKTELVTDVDQEGRSFYFKLNGKPVFMKGANYIPQDNFPSRVREENYRHLIRMAKDANMNMLRVWGGGIYENDLFYDLCDEEGILVWQDFMFACTMYPGNREFLDNVRAEAAEQVKRLRVHPCIALWCGNNEVSEGWHNWGWQDQLGYSAGQAEMAWSDYQQLFENLLPRVVEVYDSQTPYWPSSPLHGWGRQSSLHEGDMHYWGVWWGEEPFEMYEEKVGRFMSEYGFQGFPSISTLSNFLEDEDLHLGSPALDAHQKHPRGMELIRDYMERAFPVPDNLEDYAYVSQLVQAEGMKLAIEAHRRNKPRCMGTLYWQFNDCWPVISWSSIDFEGRPKAFHYYVKKAFSDILISIDKREDSIFIYAVSDLPVDTSGAFVLKVINFKGDEIFSYSEEMLITKGESAIVSKWELSELINGKDHSELLLMAGFEADGNLIAHNFEYFVKPKDLMIRPTDIKNRVEPVEEGYLITLSSDFLVKDLCIEAPGRNGHFSDNYFDLLPHVPVRVLWKTDRREEVPEFSFKSLVDVMAKEH